MVNPRLTTPIRGQRRGVWPVALLKARLWRADVNESHEPLALTGAKHCGSLGIIGEPAGDPMGAETKRIGGMTKVERDISGGQQLFEFGDFDVWRSGRDDTDGDRRGQELLALKFKLLVGSLGPLGFCDGVQSVTHSLTGIALKDDKAPWRKLAVIGNATRNFQHLRQLLGRWSRLGQKRCSDGTA